MGADSVSWHVTRRKYVPNTQTLIVYINNLVRVKNIHCLTDLISCSRRPCGGKCSHTETDELNADETKVKLIDKLGLTGDGRLPMVT